jgi:hypothetical protein
MALSSYAGISFSVYGEDGRYPAVERQDDGPPAYTATIRLASRAEYDALSALRTVVTWQPVLYTNTFNGTNHNGGPGLASLVVPSKAGTLTTYQAVLASLSNVRVSGRFGESVVCDAVFTVPAL